jgi:hypothetical protein
VHEHPLRVALRAELLAGVAERPDELLLLGVDTDHRLAQAELQLDRHVEVFELGVAVGMVGPLEDLAVGLQAVAHLVQELRHGLVTDRMPPAFEFGGKPADALGRPAQRRLGVAPGRGFDERFQVGPQGRVTVRCPGPAGAWPADPAALEGLSGPDVSHAPPDGRTGEPGRAGDGRHPAPTEVERLGADHQPAGPLVDQRGHRPVPRPDRHLIDHPPILLHL